MFKVIEKHVAVYKCIECGIRFTVDVSRTIAQETLPCRFRSLRTGRCYGVAYLEREILTLREVRKTADEMFGKETPDNG